MTPREIARLKQHSPRLQEALKADSRLYHFLRDECIARFDYYPQCAAHTCEQCGVITFPTLKTPYNAFHPGWCLDCTLDAFLSDDPPARYDPYYDPNAPEYDPVRAREKAMWDSFYENNYDGPPIEMA